MLKRRSIQFPVERPVQKAKLQYTCTYPETLHHNMPTRAMVARGFKAWLRCNNWRRKATTCQATATRKDIRLKTFSGIGAASDRQP